MGCIGCPMAGKKRYEQFRKWPQYEKLYIMAFDRMVAVRNAKGLHSQQKTGQEVFSWWMEENVLPGQMTLDEVTL